MSARRISVNCYAYFSTESCISQTLLFFAFKQIVYRAAHVFEETALGLQRAMARFGVHGDAHLLADDQELIDQPLAAEFQDPTHLFVVICDHYFALMPHTYILLQLEQLAAFQYLQKHLPDALVIWEFSSFGLSFLRHVLHMPASYMPAYTNFEKPAEATSDGSIAVLFFGWIHLRRLPVLQALLNAGVPLTIKELVYGSELDEAVREAQIVVNIHRVDSASLEVHRLNRLLLQGKCIVSEPSSDPILDAIYSRGVVFAHVGDIVEVLHELLADPGQRRIWEVNALRLGNDLQDNLSPLKQGLMLAIDALSQIATPAT
ncbi:hypothetical protein JKP88DRAFT_208218 [Tribonema minus]|uniref:Glycosyltransferase family 1 protein n=1 Tax=Tribonema minus TaxID=303371 RepID=A0A835Z1K0_9STRA|nr:hypothetical protein JKP88DRAFT_208218 [Tribonema minus]